MLDGFKKAIPINWELIGNPVNWVVVALMIALAGVALAVIIKPGTLFATEENE
jgi:hypothetical protein